MSYSDTCACTVETCDWCGKPYRDDDSPFLEIGVDLFDVNCDEVCRSCWLEGHLREQV